jgi:hypothetical protein
VHWGGIKGYQGGVSGTLSGPSGPYPGVLTWSWALPNTFGKKLKIAILVPNRDIKCPFFHLYL